MADSPVPSTLSGLQTYLTSQILQNAGQMAITEANVGIADLANLLNSTIGPDLVLSGAMVTSTNSSVILAGTITLYGAAFQASLTFTQANSGF